MKAILDATENGFANSDDRCDLNRLLLDNKKHQVNLRNNYETQKRASIARNLSWAEIFESTASANGVSVESFVLLAWHKVLNVFAGGDETVLLSRTELDSDAIGITLVNVVRHSDHDDLTSLEAARDTETSYKPFSAAQSFDTGPFDSYVHLTAASFSDPDAVLATHPLSIQFSIDRVAGRLDYCLQYAEELFHHHIMTGFCDSLDVIFQQVSTAPNGLLRHIEYIAPSQIEALEQWNGTDGEYDRTLRLNNLIEKAAELTPLNTAVIYKERELSFQQLNEQANMLAHYLRLEVGVATEQVVALFLSKSELMITVVLSVWKSGSAYTPVDPTYPDARVLFSLEDTATKLILTNACHVERIRRVSSHLIGMRIVVVDSLLDQLAGNPKILRSNPDFGLRSDQLSYLTYTSGTTGVPKGIKKHHTNVVNSITDIAHRYGVKESREAVVLFSPYVFEPFARQLLVALANSQTLVVVDDDEKLDPVVFEAILREQRITYLNGTASVLLEYDYSRCPNLKRLVLVGEDLTETRYRALRKKFKNRIINEYGFTESAFVTAIKVFEPDSDRPNRSLGRPLRNVKCYVLDRHMKRLPPGAQGELYIGGQGIAEGYWNRADLTKQRFLPNPFQTSDEKSRGANSRIYRTGDLARWIPDAAEVEYIGRNDFQIKLRGIRIEPMEIESVLSTHSSVVRAIVVAKAATIDGCNDSALATMHLVGYWTGQSSTTESDLIEFLDKKLPRYMVPTRLIHIPRVPTTINGKVDFRALPDVSLISQHQDKRAPRNASEMQLRDIWSKLLAIPEHNIGIDDIFFRLGGNSITCIQLVGQVRRHMNMRLTVEQIFTEKTIERLAKISNSPISNEVVVPTANVITPEAIGVSTPVDGIYSANSLQQGFMYHFLKTGGKDHAYTMQTVCTYDVDIDTGRYLQAWEHVQRQYCSLRMRFVSGLQIYQVIDKQQLLDFRSIDMSASDDRGEKEFCSLLDTDLAEPYQLDTGPLVRVYLVRLGTKRHRLLFSCHHASLDGWSLPIVLDRVHESYVDGIDENPPAADTIFHASQQLAIRLGEEHLPYWRNEVEHITERCDLRGLIDDAVRYKINLSSYDTIREQKVKSISLGQTWNSSLKDACARSGVMLHTVLQFVCHQVLHAYGHGRQSVVGTIVSGRDLPLDDIERGVGLFINTLPLVVDHNDLRSQSVIDAMQSLQQKVIAMNMHSCVELGKLTPGKLTHELFDCLLVLENYPILDQPRRTRLQKALQIKTQGTSEKLTYPLVFVCSEDPETGDVVVRIRYAAELFAEGTIDDILDVFQSLFQQISRSEGMDQPITSLEFLGSRQLARLAGWNDSNVPYPQVTLDSLFEQTAVQHGFKVAVIYEDDKLTYAALNAKANQLARLLRKRVDTKPDTVIGLFLRKNIDMFICILAVWKSGCAWVPIDPNFPADRISFILKDTAAVMLLTNDALLDRLHIVSTPAIILPVESALERATCESERNLEPISCNTDLAYIFFTSGTTGKPKGVMIEHRGVVNLQRSLCKTFDLQGQPDEVLLSFSNYTFDHFVEQMTDALLTGQTLLILNDEMRADKERLYEYMTRYSVTYLSGTPSVISMYDYESFPKLRRIDCVGEDFSEPVFNNIRRGFDGQIINGYGPTEVSITTHKRLYQRGERRANKSIGFQIDNSRTYIFNGDMKPIPIGAIGFLFLGGDGVGRGYLNRPDLTEDRFPPNPYQSVEDRAVGRDSRLYKTGDLARWLPNGEIEFLGREDFQIKLRGQRVELGEIEAAITSCTGIVQSVVVPRTRKIEGSLVAQQFLTGYFVTSESRSEADVKGELRTKLPEHLIPNRLVPVEILPVTASGKLDTKKLPEVAYSICTAIVSPADDTEAKLCSIWGNLLGLPSTEVSVVEDFFSLGGDSLLSTKLSFVTTNEFDRRVTVADIFKHRTIREMASFILNRAPIAKGSKLAKFSSGKPARASLAQERLLFIDSFLGGTNAYNVAKYLSIPLSTSRPALQQALSSLLVRHEALRTLLVPDSASFKTMQHVVSPDLVTGELLPLDEVKLENLEELNQLLDSEIRGLFDLQRRVPVRMILAEVESPSLLILAFHIHHTAIDAWSWSILTHDLSKLYMQYLTRSTRPKLAPLSFSQGAYSISQRLAIEQAYGQSMKKFWTEKLDGYSGVELPTDFTRPKTFQHNGSDLPLTVDRDMMERIHNMARAQQITPFSIFAAAYLLFLRAYSNQNDIVIGLPMANRTQTELESAVGCFMNMVALRIRIDGAATLNSFISHVNREIQLAHLNQEYPFESLVKDLGVESSQDRHPIFQHVFSSDIISTVANATSSDEESIWPMKDFQPTVQIFSSSKVDLSTTVTSQNGFTFINFNWPLALFREDTIAGFAATYKRILDQLINQDRSKPQVRTMLLIEPAKRNEIIANGNGHSTETPSLGSIFNMYARDQPNSTAVVCNDERLSYNELRVRSNRMARLLATTGLCAGQFVGFMMEPSLDMIVCMLAAWLLGVAYVPMDPHSTPTERMKDILHETSLEVVISHSKHLPALGPVKRTKAMLILLDEYVVQAQIQANPPDDVAGATSNSIAYIIYTSGTTGKAKGVLVPHRSVVSFAENVRSKYFSQEALGQSQSVLMVSSYVFDFSVEQIALSLLSGHKLVLLPRGITADDGFYEYLNREKLTYISGTPSILSQLDFSRLRYLEMVTSAGEQLKPSQFSRMRLGFSKRINNAYGTTETTVYNLVQHFDLRDDFVNSLGEPLPGQQAYIANSDFQLLPVGAIGELFLAGDGVTNGYLQRPELTRERFVTNIFQSSLAKGGSSGRMYRTGDVVRRLPTGALEFRGRNDHQVKIRGFRVELEEVQTALAAYPPIDSCVVLARRRGRGTFSASDVLVGYYTSTSGECPIKAIEAFLAERLPKPLIPSYIKYVPGQLPTTVTGKLDTHRLPSFETTSKYMQRLAPKNALETKLCRAWSSMLGTQIGVDDDFFRCGGDSIMSLQLVRDILDQTGLRVTVKDIFEHRTVAGIVQHVEGTKLQRTIDLQTEQGALQGPLELLPIQKWFFDKQLSYPDHWNQCFVIDTPSLDIIRLRQALDDLQTHHDALRISYHLTDKKNHQRYNSAVPRIELHELKPESEKGLKMELTKLQGSLHLASGRVAIAAYIRSQNQLVFAIHHLVVDTVSWRIIAQDLQTLYEGGALSLKGTSFRQWTSAMSNYIPSDEEIKYWHGVTERCSQSTLPEHLQNQSQETLEFSKQNTKSIFTAAADSLGFSAQEVLLTVLSRALYNWNPSVGAVTLEGHGREAFDQSLDVSRCVGWFTTMYPLLLPPWLESLRDHISETARALKSVPNKGLGYGVLHGYRNMPEVTFNYLGKISRGNHIDSHWRLESAMDGNLGQCQNQDDVSANESMLDVTAWVDDGRLKLELKGRLCQSTMQGLARGTQQQITKFLQLVQEAQDKDHTVSVITPTTEAIHFIPYFSFMETPRQGPIVFFFPPGEGGAESYFNNLVTALGDVRLVTFNNLHLHDPQPHVTFEDLASRYVGWMKETQPAGPYHLVGWSFGGVLALQIALQLVRAGETISSLNMIDSYLDVASVSAAIGYPEDRTILDPINWHYRPDTGDLAALQESTAQICLFKAPLMNDRARDDRQTKLFEWYLASEYNGLDSLISAQRIQIESLTNETHFSWVKNDLVVERIARVVRPRPHVNESSADNGVQQNGVY